MTRREWLSSGLIILAFTLSVNARPMDAELITSPHPAGGSLPVSEIVQYPDMALDMGIEGQVILRFRINEYGSVSDIQIIQSGGYLLDEAAIAAVCCAEWAPARYNDKPYSVLFQLPFKFCLN